MDRIVEQSDREGDTVVHFRRGGEYRPAAAYREAVYNSVGVNGVYGVCFLGKVCLCVF